MEDYHQTQRLRTRILPPDPAANSDYLEKSWVASQLNLHNCSLGTYCHGQCIDCSSPARPGWPSSLHGTTRHLLPRPVHRLQQLSLPSSLNSTTSMMNSFNSGFTWYLPRSVHQLADTRARCTAQLCNTWHKTFILGSPSEHHRRHACSALHARTMPFTLPALLRS